MKKIAITGGSGFIGQRLRSVLDSEIGYETLNIDKSTNQNFEPVDIRNLDALNEILKNTNIIVHLAAEHQDNVRPHSLYYDVNVNGTSNVCWAAVKNNINTIIFLSSVAVYGFNEAEVDESSKVCPSNDYGKTKLMAEEILLQWQSEAPNRKLVIIRPTVVFGEGNRGNVFNLFKQIATSRFVMIGDGKNKKSIAYVGNLVEFITQIIKDNITGVRIFNYIDKPDLTMASLVSLIQTALNQKKQFTFHIPYFLAYFFAGGLDLIGWLFRINLPISRIRIRKFCSNSIYRSVNLQREFRGSTSLYDAILKTIEYEFLSRK